MGDFLVTIDKEIVFDKKVSNILPGAGLVASRVK